MPEGMIYLDRYQEAAKETAIYDWEIGNQLRDLDIEHWEDFLSLMYCVSKLNGEAGEVSELVAKALRDGYIKELQTSGSEVRERLIKELGDVLWYVAMIAMEIDISLSAVATRNIEKLRSRQERGVLGGSGDER